MESSFRETANVRAGSAAVKKLAGIIHTEIAFFFSQFMELE